MLADVEEMEALWQAVFEDDVQDIRSFLHRFLADNTAWIVRKESMIVSMLFVLDAQLVIGDDVLSVGYIYAGATHLLHRGQGLYHRLLLTAEQDAAARGLSALFLQPADDVLAQTYERMGYTVPLFTSVLKGRVHSAVGETLSPAQYMQRRDALLSQRDIPFIQWPLAVYDQCAAWDARLELSEGHPMMVTFDERMVLEYTGDESSLCECDIGRLKPLDGQNYDKYSRIYMGYGMD